MCDPLDKAGAYGIQDGGEMIVESIDGADDNVMDLPVAAVLAAIGNARSKARVFEA